MKKRNAQTRSVKPILNAVTSLGDEVVRILSQLTRDVELFESMIGGQRQVIELHTARRGVFDDDQIRRHSQRVGADAAEVAARARHALRELRGLSQGVEAEERQTG